ncbi:MAG TPA: hypothetical protein VK116_15700, partial [Planctomycetota bacterium]|nr:hypothetical protein [Planctomycetota bacterium]
MRKKSERTELEIVRAIERTRHVARALSLPFVDLAAYRVSPGILRKIPLETAERHRCVPIVWNHRRVILACAEPADVAWLLSRPEEVGCARVGWPVADEDDE